MIDGFEVFDPDKAAPWPPEAMFTAGGWLLLNPAAVDLLHEAARDERQAAGPGRVLGRVELLFHRQAGYVAVRPRIVGSLARTLPLIPAPGDWPLLIPAVPFLLHYGLAVPPGATHPARLEDHDRGDRLLVIGLHAWSTGHQR